MQIVTVCRSNLAGIARTAKIVRGFSLSTRSKTKMASDRVLRPDWFNRLAQSAELALLYSPPCASGEIAHSGS
jgi:hypothetical protein